jgi:Fe-S cluster assembly protein SufD
MTAQATKEQSSYRARFEEFFEGAKRGEPSWLAHLREGAFARFEERGFPTTDEEDWKYTNVAPIARGEFRHARVDEGAAAVHADAVARFVSAESARSRLVFVNGVYQPGLSDLSALPSGVVVADIAAAARGGELAPPLRDHLSRSDAHGEDAFGALNTALFGAGAFLYVPENVKAEAPIQFLFLAAEAEAETAAYPRVLVVAGRG